MLEKGVTRISNSIYLSSALLLLANLYPVYGILYLGWDPGIVISSYVGEALIIMVFTILKIYLSKPLKRPNVSGFDLEIEEEKPNKRPTIIILFLTTLLGVVFYTQTLRVLSRGAFKISDYLFVREFLIMITIIFISHLFSLISNYMINGEYKKSKVSDLSFGYYFKKIIPMAFSSIMMIGSFDIYQGGNISIVVIIAIIIKTFIDLFGHISEHKGYLEPDLSKTWSKALEEERFKRGLKDNENLDDKTMKDLLIRLRGRL